MLGLCELVLSFFLFFIGCVLIAQISEPNKKSFIFLAAFFLFVSGLTIGYKAAEERIAGNSFVVAKDPLQGKGMPFFPKLPLVSLSWEDSA